MCVWKGHREIEISMTPQLKRCEQRVRFRVCPNLRKSLLAISTWFSIRRCPIGMSGRRRKKRQIRNQLRLHLGEHNKQSMTPFKTFAALIIAIVLVGLFSVWIHAAEATKKLAGDRIMTPTKIKPLDINSGPIEQLKMLPGIDAVQAQKIVDSRPYQKKDELVSRKIIPEATYKRIKDRIIAVPVS